MNQSAKMNKNIIIAAMGIAVISLGVYLMYGRSNDDLTNNAAYKTPEENEIPADDHNNNSENMKIPY